MQRISVSVSRDSFEISTMSWKCSDFALWTVWKEDVGLGHGNISKAIYTIQLSLAIKVE